MTVPKVWSVEFEVWSSNEKLEIKIHRFAVIENLLNLLTLHHYFNFSKKTQKNVKRSDD